MSGTKASTFFWSDWRSDTNLQLCGYGAKGLWMDMLGIMAAHGGYLRIGDRNLEPADVAKMTGGSVEEVTALTAELERNGVFSRDRRRTIFSRRQVRVEKNRRNGQLGGEAKSRADNANQDSPPETACPLLPLPIPIPEEGRENLPQQVGAGNVIDDWPEDFFDRFWPRYPPGRKTDKKAVRAKLERIRRDREVTFAKLMAAVDRYAIASPDPNFTKAPLVWLNKGCWDDEFALRTGGAKGGGNLTMLEIAQGAHKRRDQS